MEIIDNITSLLGDDLKHSVASLPNEKLTGLKFMCFLLTGLKRLAPEAAPQTGLKDAYLQAVEIYSKPIS